MAKYIDLTGQKFNNWTIIKLDESEDASKYKHKRWICQCICGKIKSVNGASLKNGESKSCGCSRGTTLIDLTGLEFGRWTVIDRAPNKPNSKIVYWNCVCKCGKHSIVSSQVLREGLSQSCGCWNSEATSQRNYKHGKAKTRLYHIWNGMKGRTLCETNSVYSRYGGAGRGICEEWQNDYSTFEQWALNNGYADNLSIDRIDNNKGYSPNNCRWVDAKIQANNTKSNRHIEINGITHTLAEWSDISGVKAETISRRIKCGWDESKWLIPPIK